ncbi:hypothetical protein HCN44_011149 [Aphidius gifuensis]|uniref:Peptidase S1 domain-containing protein n=1 Tax=Aphidius gifuensis TaxID=684658 RepID=A0A834XXC4_APHGI|nr:chymotrypsin-1-like [Aphidius gifuensis]KAF7993880.1 hypothetical protein HCN44_011149 [Aphidius gifuensis]
MKNLKLIFFLSISSVLGNLENRIIKGIKAKEGELPSSVAIYMNGNLKCGGTIIDEIHIITAAHCCQQLSPKELTVLTGANDLSSWLPKSYGVSQIYIHEDYINSGSFENDIAILSLSENIYFNSVTKAIKLPTQETPENTNLTLSGWGKTKDSNGKNDLPTDLMKLETKIISNSLCKKWLLREINDSQICTFISNGQGACTGDSGGGLVDGNTLVGVASWIAGKKGCATGYPDVFTRVYSFVPWITKILNN